MTTALVKKLQLKAGAALLVRNAPEGILAALQGALAGLSVGEDLETFTAGLVFVNNLEEVGRLIPQCIALLPPDALFWAAYPKGSSGVATDVNRDRLWEAITPMGLRPVRQIALDDTWSAIRIRPA